MATRVTTSICKKVGQPNYGSIGASCQVEFELDPSLLDDLETFHEKVHGVYVACCQAVNDELARHQEKQAPAGRGEPEPDPPGPTPDDKAAPTNGGGNGTGGRPATEKQLKFIGNLVRGIKGLGNGRLEQLSNRMFGKPVDKINSLEASALIDQLKAIKAGDIDVGAALEDIMASVVARPLAHDDRQGGILDYVSPTRLNLWLRCPLAFRLRYVDGIVPPTTPALFIGQMTHRALEYFYRHRQLGIELGPEEVIGHLDNVWLGSSSDVAFDSEADEKAGRQQVDRLVRCYLEQVPEEPPPVAVETCLEAPLVAPDTGEDFGSPLVGIVDLVVDGNLVDFKTTARGG